MAHLHILMVGLIWVRQWPCEQSHILLYSQPVQIERPHTDIYNQEGSMVSSSFSVDERDIEKKNQIRPLLSTAVSKWRSRAHKT
jgi:hypothetical protein